MKIVGIDPGIKGALTLIDSQSILEIIDMPLEKIEVKKGKEMNRVSGEGVRDILSYWNNNHNIDCVLIEKQKVLSGVEGRVSIGVTMEGYGLLKGICIGLNIPLMTVDAKGEWQKYYRDTYPQSGEDIKKLSVRWAYHLYPDAPLLKSKRCSVPSDGRSDSLLIAHYGLYLINNKE